MKRLITILLFLIAPVLIQAQSVSVAPKSMMAWGKTSSTASASVEYKGAGLHIFDSIKQTHVQSGEKGGGTYYALSYKPIRHKYGRLGMIAFNRPFPFPSSTRVNFWIEAKVPVGDHLEFSYIHISNGYTGEINTGLDTISIRYKF